MRITDIITGLAFVQAHVGLYRLDRGLRDGINVPIEQLQSNVQMLSRSAQAVTITNQIKQLKAQATQFQKQHLNAQHAQLMVQVGQLNLQLQQLTVERQRLEIEVKKEKRLEQENRIMRLFIDLYDQAQTFRQQGQYLDFLVVILAVFRIYRQIYNDLDDPKNRLQVSDLKGKLFDQIKDVFETPVKYQSLLGSYTSALQVPISVTSKGRQWIAESSAAFEVVKSFRTPIPESQWPQRLGEVDSQLARLQQIYSQAAPIRDEYLGLSTDADLRELFFPLYGESINALAAGITPTWAEWVRAVETQAGTYLENLYQSFQDDPKTIESAQQQLPLAAQEVQKWITAYKIACAVSGLKQTLPVYQVRFNELRRQFAEQITQSTSADVQATLKRSLSGRTLALILQMDFRSFQGYSQSIKTVNNKRYLQAAAQHLASVNGPAVGVSVDFLQQVFALDQQVSSFASEISGKLQKDQQLLNKAVESDAGFQNLSSQIRIELGADLSAEIERRVVAYQAELVKKFSLSGAKGKEMNRRRYIVEAAVDAYSQAHAVPLGTLPDLTQLPMLPPSLN